MVRGRCAGPREKDDEDRVARLRGDAREVHVTCVQRTIDEQRRDATRASSSAFMWFSRAVWCSLVVSRKLISIASFWIV